MNKEIVDTGDILMMIGSGGGGGGDTDMEMKL
jgi:hypothetical protein